MRRLAAIAPASADPAISGEDALAGAIRHALELGVNLMDTDWISQGGHAQEVLGRAMAGRREGLLITSKAGPRLAFHGALTLDNSRANLINQCHDSLFRLKTSLIDLYQVHWPDATAPQQTARGLQDVIHAGYARWAGVCNYSLAQVQALAPLVEIKTVQAPLNLLNRRAMADLLPWCITNKVGFLAADPLLSGLLTGDFRGDEDFTQDDMDEHFTQPAFGRAAAFARDLASLGHPGQLAVGWCLARPGVSCVLVPPLPAHEFDSIAAAEPLQAAQVAEIDRLARAHGFLA